MIFLSVFIFYLIKYSSTGEAAVGFIICYANTVKVIKKRFFDKIHRFLKMLLKRREKMLARQSKIDGGNFKLSL